MEKEHLSESLNETPLASPGWANREIAHGINEIFERVSERELEIIQQSSHESVQKWSPDRGTCSHC